MRAGFDAPSSIAAAKPRQLRFRTRCYRALLSSATEVASNKKQWAVLPWNLATGRALARSSGPARSPCSYFASASGSQRWSELASPPVLGDWTRFLTGATWNDRLHNRQSILTGNTSPPPAGRGRKGNRGWVSRRRRRSSLVHDERQSGSRPADGRGSVLTLAV